MAKDDLLYTIPRKDNMLAKLYRVPRGKKRGSRLSELPEVKPTDERETSYEEQEIGKIRRQIGDHPGDDRLAREIYRNLQEIPRSTVPELVVKNWLDKERQQYWYQTYALGGRAPGGIMPDFVVTIGGRGVAWQVQGSYHHSAEFQGKHNQQGRDIVAELRLRGQTVNGVEITTVVSLEEDDIYNRRPAIFWQAMSGLTV